MDHLQRILPKHLKRTNHIYLASEHSLFAPYSEADESDESVTLINDDAQLSDVIAIFRRESKLKSPGAGKKLLDAIVKTTTLNLAFIKIDLTKLANEHPVDVKSIDKSKYIILREDNITDRNLSDFLNIYCSTAPTSQPQIIIVPNVDNSKIENRLRYVSSDISVSWLIDGHRENLVIPRSGPLTIEDFTTLYDQRCFEAVARTDPKRLLDRSSRPHAIAETAVRLLHLRARLLTTERHYVEPDVDTLLSDLDQLIDIGISKETESYLIMRSLVLLQKAYCSEKPAYLNEALAISSTLGHELGVAMCLRLAHFLDVHPALEAHMLNRAEDTFRRNDCPDLAIYCANNRLVSRFSANDDFSEGLDDLIARIDHETPVIHRRGDIFYNVGVEHLFAGRIDRARSIFESITLSNARPLVVACAALGKMTCERLEGRFPGIEEAVELAKFVDSHVAPTNRWHITNLFLNLLTLYEERRADFDSLRRNIEPYVSLDYDLDVRDVYSENRLMAVRLGLCAETSLVQRKIGGRFGRFFERHGMTIPYFFIWS